jgi:hypothetical protein
MSMTRKEAEQDVRPHLLIAGLVLIVVLSFVPAATAQIVGQPGTVEGPYFEIEGNHSALNGPCLIQDSLQGLDWRRADWIVTGYVNKSPDPETPVCDFGVISDSNQTTDPWDCYNFEYQTCAWDGGPGYLIQDDCGKDLTTFTEGSKFDSIGSRPYTGTPNWNVLDGTVGPDQNDLTNVYIYAVRDGEIINVPAESDECLDPGSGIGECPTPVPHEVNGSWLMLGMERLKKEGTFDLDFELNQNPWNEYPPCEDCGPERKTGDISVGFELFANPNNASTDLTILIVRFDTEDTTCSNGEIYNLSNLQTTDECKKIFKDAVYGEDWCGVFCGNGALLSKYGFATMNAFPINAPPWGTLTKSCEPSDSTPEFNFAEAAINLTALHVPVGCPGFGTAHAKSKASLSFTAALKDLAGPITLAQNCVIEGCKYIDSNGDGDITSDSVYGAGWPVSLFKESDDSYVLESTTTTNTSGCYNFSGLSDGHYSVAEGHLAGWTQTFPSDSDSCPYVNGCEIDCDNASLGCVYTNISMNIENAIQTGYDFGNFENVSVKACKLEDADGNLSTTDDQSPIKGWTVFLTENGSQIDEQTTGDDGCYNWTDLGPTDTYYDVEENVPAGWTPLTDTEYDFDPILSGEAYNFTFVNFENVSVKACKLIDADGDLGTTGDQTIYEGWPVYLSIDGERQTPGETTGADGCYNWTDLGPGHSYDVEEDVLAGYENLTETEHDFGPASSGASYSFTFINWQPPTGCVGTPGMWLAKLCTSNASLQNAGGVIYLGNPGGLRTVSVTNVTTIQRILDLSGKQGGVKGGYCSYLGTPDQNISQLYRMLLSVKLSLNNPYNASSNCIEDTTTAVDNFLTTHTCGDSNDPAYNSSWITVMNSYLNGELCAPHCNTTPDCYPDCINPPPCPKPTNKGTKFISIEILDPLFQVID